MSEDDLDGEGFAKGARPLCPFCSKPWSAKMMGQMVECDVSIGYYGDPDGVTAHIDIECDGCERPIYRKEVQPYWRTY